jgi:hypothetical protein
MENTETVFKEKHCVCDPMPELNAILPDVDSRVDITHVHYHEQHHARVELNPLSSLFLSSSQLPRIWPLDCRTITNMIIYKRFKEELFMLHV